MINLKVVENNGVKINDEIRAMQGIGAENVTKDDIAMPRITILQSMSPQVNRNKPEWIEGAETGDWCNVSNGTTYKESISVLPCLFATRYLEFSKSRQFVRDHGENPSIILKCTQDDKWRNVLSNGNEIVETAQWFCLLRDGPDGSPWSPVYLPLKATSLKLSRRWLTQCRPTSIRDDDGRPFNPPLYWWSWRLKVVAESNKAGDWYAFRPEKEARVIDLDPSFDLARQCKAFHDVVGADAVRSKAVRSEEDAPHRSEGFGRNSSAGSATLEDDAIPFA